jgi:ankyrin repeat protein
LINIFYKTSFAGQYESVELLLSRGIDVDLFDSVHGTALHIAASKGEAGLVKLLLEHHADVSTSFFLLPLAVLTNSHMLRPLACVARI